VDRAVDGHATRPGCAATYLFEAWSAFFVFFMFPFALPCSQSSYRGCWSWTGIPLLSETVWKEGEPVWNSRHASVCQC
jgi:hypothetical protein